MGHNSDKMYITHAEHAAGSHAASSTGKRAEIGKGEVQRLPLQQERIELEYPDGDCCALSLQPFRNPVAVVADDAPRADVFDLLNIVPYVRKYKTNPVTGKAMDTTGLIKLNFFKNAEGNMHDPITYKVFSPHIHIVFLKNTGNVFDMASLQLLAIKPKTWRDLVSDEPFKREDIITIQDPSNLASRDLSTYDYVKNEKKVDEDDLKGDPLKGINVDAAGGASKVLRMLAEKTRTEKAPATPEPVAVPERTKEGVVAKRKVEQLAYNATNFSTGRASASLTSTSFTPTTVNERALLDEEEFADGSVMFDEMKKAVKDKDRLKNKAYATIMTNLGGLNVELHGDRAPRTVFNFVQLAKAGKYDDVIFHRLIAGFMIQGGDPSGTGRGGQSHWGEPFADEYSEKGAYKHDARGVLSMANQGPRTNTSQFFITFRPVPHLDGKHTVFGKLVGGEDVLDRIEKCPVRPGTSTERPVKDIVITGVQVLQDPFESYQVKLKERLARRDQSDAALRAREERRAEREKDRTTWLGTNLGEKGEKGPVKPAPASASGTGGAAGRKRERRDEEEIGVGKYLGAGNAAKGTGMGTVVPPSMKKQVEQPIAALSQAPGSAVEFGAEKKKRKGAGGFGDFSGW